MGAAEATDETRKRARFHDLRGSGLTWMAIRGDDPLKIQQRAGHRTFEMTQKYIRTAEAVGEVIGGHARTSRWRWSWRPRCWAARPCSWRWPY